MKVNTIEQYKVLEYIEENFNVENVRLELKDRYAIKLIDKNNQSLVFVYTNNEVKCYEK